MPTRASALYRKLEENKNSKIDFKSRIVTINTSAIISQVYCKDTDYGSIAVVHTEAKATHSSITRANVEDWIKEHVKEKPKKNGLPVKIKSTLTKDKIKIIEGAFYHEHGYGTPAQVYKELKKEGKAEGITLANVTEWKQVRPMTGFNSYVAPHTGFEFQVDLFYFKDKEREYHFGDYNYGLLAIDTFSKYVWVIPLTRKRAPHCLKKYLSTWESQRLFIQIPTQVWTLMILSNI